MSRSRLVPLLVAVLAAACDSSSRSGGAPGPSNGSAELADAASDGAGGDEGGSGGDAPSAGELPAVRTGDPPWTVGAEGAVIAWNGVALTIPVGALAAPESIAIEVSPAAAPAGYDAWSPVYRFTPEGLVFDALVEVALPLPAGHDAAAASVFWSRADHDLVWNASEAGSVEGDVVRTTTTHFSDGFVGDGTKFPGGCGDGICGSDEIPFACPADCDDWQPCGDGFCDLASETLESCRRDCAHATLCGDGTCDPGRAEDLVTCPADCSRDPDGVCDADENALVSPDCPAEYPAACGDGLCGPGEGPCDCWDDPENECPGTVSPDGCSERPSEKLPGETDAAFALRQHGWDCSLGRVPECALDLCLRHEVHLELIHSNYNVDWTAGNGEHQGLGVRKYTKVHDTRTGKHCRTFLEPTAPNGVIRYLWNHGRTVRTSPHDMKPGYRVEWEIVPAPYTVWANPAGDPKRDRLVEIAKTYETCATAMPDGFCDQVCGNDGYTLPDSYWTFTDDFVPCPSTSFTNKDAHLPTGAGPAGPARGCVRQAFTWRTIIPRWGHNSNTDATAEREWFRACSNDLDAADKALTPKAWLDKNAEFICENYCDSVPFGSACFSQRDIATWKVDWCNGCMNLPTDLAGDAPGGQPTAACHAPAACMWGTDTCPFPPGKAVKGM